MSGDGEHVCVHGLAGRGVWQHGQRGPEDSGGGQEDPLQGAVRRLRQQTQPRQTQHAGYCLTHLLQTLNPV